MSYGNQPPYPPQHPGPPPSQGGWGPPTGQYPPAPYQAVPPPRKNNGLVIAVIVSVVVVFCMLIGAVGLLAGGEDEPTAGTATVGTTGDAVDGLGATATAEPSSAAPTTAAPKTTAPAVKTVVMPKVTGENAAVADDQLRKLGFTNIQYGSQDRDDTVVLLLSNWPSPSSPPSQGRRSQPIR